jgi:hypothetical protein
MVRYTAEQLARLAAIVEEWNAIRDNSRQRATVGEVVDFLITQEEIGLQAMRAADAREVREVREVREELAREDLADEKPLPPIKLADDSLNLAV